MNYYKNLILFSILVQILGGKNLIIHNTYDPTARELLDAEIVGNTLILPGNLQGIEFYDISNPQTPVHLDNLQLQGGGGGGGNTRCYYARGTGNVVYITTHRGVAIINISNPSNPQFNGYISGTQGNQYILENMDIFGNVLAVSAHTDGLFLFDISNPANPIWESTFPVLNAWAVNLYGDFAFVSDGEAIRVLDVSDIQNPVEIYSWATGSAVKDLSIDNGLLYAALGSEGVSVYDLTNPDSPVFLSNYNTSALANRVQPFNSKCAVADWDDVEILEWNGIELELVGFKANGRRTMAINASGNYIYSAEWMWLQVFEFGEIEDADIDISSWEINYPYVENGDSYTLSVDVTNNGNSQLIIEDQYISNTDFQIENLLQNLSPGETQTVNIAYSADAGNSSSGYWIFTNDPDEPPIIVELNGNIDGINIGEPAPDFELDVIANGNGSFRLSDHLGQIVVLAFFSPG